MMHFFEQRLFFLQRRQNLLLGAFVVGNIMGCANNLADTPVGFAKKNCVAPGKPMPFPTGVT